MHAARIESARRSVGIENDSTPVNHSASTSFVFFLKKHDDAMSSSSSSSSTYRSGSMPAASQRRDAAGSMRASSLSSSSGMSSRRGGGSSTRDNSDSEEMLAYWIRRVGNTIYYVGDVIPPAAADIKALLLEAAALFPVIVLYIQSLGGDAFSCYSIYDHIRLLPCEVITVADGNCFSAGTIIHAAGHRRYALPTSFYKAHAGRYSVSGACGSGLPYEYALDALSAIRDQERAARDIYIKGIREVLAERLAEGLDISLPLFRRGTDGDGIYDLGEDSDGDRGNDRARVVTVQGRQTRLRGRAGSARVGDAFGSGNNTGASDNNEENDEGGVDVYDLPRSSRSNNHPSSVQNTRLRERCSTPERCLAAIMDSENLLDAKSQVNFAFSHAIWTPQLAQHYQVMRPSPPSRAERRSGARGADRGDRSDEDDADE